MKELIDRYLLPCFTFLNAICLYPHSTEAYAHIIRWCNFINATSACLFMKLILYAASSCGSQVLSVVQSLEVLLSISQR